MTDTPERSRGETRWIQIQDRISKGLCRDCGAKRGKTGTRDRCRRCADERNAYTAAYRARQAAKAAAGDKLAHALGMTVPRPMRASGEPLAVELRNGATIQTTITPADQPSASIDPAAPWALAHWRVKARIVKGDRVLAQAAPFIVSAGHDYAGEPPPERDVLALACLDAADAALPFAEWCTRLGLSSDSMRAAKAYKVAGRRAAAWRELFGKEYDAVASLILGEKETT